MKCKTHKIQFSQAKLLTSAMAGLAATCFMLNVSQAQTLQLRYTFDDGPGTTATDDPSSAIYPVTLDMVTASGTPADLHGPANSGVQNQGHSLNLSTNPIAGNVNGAYAFVTNSPVLGNLGIVSNFTATIWFKMSSLITNLNNTGSRLFVLATNTVTDVGPPNSIGVTFGVGNGATTFPANAINLSPGNGPVVSCPIYYNFPTNVWLFLAVTYDSVGGNAEFYYGTEASPAKLYTVKNIGAGTNFNFSGGASLSLGSGIANGTGFPGSIGEFRFYTGTGNSNFIENIRQSSTPIVVSGLTPDGSVLMSGTNILSFTASSTNGINTSGIDVAVNGTDVSSSLIFGGTPTSRTVTYTNLPVNPALAQQANLNGVVVNIQVTDNGGIVTSNSYTYDAFAPTNFTWEAEDYDFNGGSYSNNPTYAFNSNDPYYQASGDNGIDYFDDGANGAAQAQVYRNINDLAATEYSLGAGNNGGNSIGELMRQKILNALSLDSTIREVDVSYFDGPGLTDGSPTFGTPNWMNYTRTYPAGVFNVYVRAAYGNVTPGGSTLSNVTGGWGGLSQTTTNLGTFTLANSGGWESYSWVPLSDVNGNLVQVKLGGTNTFQLTANNGGGGNVNFLMLTPANTNTPVLTGIYPNGTNMFQPSATLTFGASSPTSVTINTNSIKVQLLATNLTGQTLVTNLTATNGLTITGTSTSRSVSAVLTSNLLYAAVIQVTDANGNSAKATVHFDTLSPSYTWEAPDYDYNGGQFIPNPIPVDGYSGLVGEVGTDYYYGGIAVNPSPSDTYRPSDTVGIEDDGDIPLRLQFLTNSPAPQPYDVGYYNSGDWLNYTRVFPAGQYNIFIRAADGSTSGGLGSVSLSRVTNSVSQTTTNLGNFAIPVTGGWQTYNWVPLRDGSGNLVKFTGGTTTLKATSAGSQNVFFYALFPANTSLPSLNNVYPNGTTLSQSTNTFGFSVQAAAGISTNSIVVAVNSVNVTNLVFTPVGLGGTNWSVSYPYLQPNAAYTIAITATDANGNVAKTTVSFDTFSSANYTWEAEDFDYNGGQFIDNPQTNAYYKLGAVSNVDSVQVNFGGVELYRTNVIFEINDNSSGMDTEVNGDLPRPQYEGTGFTNYGIGYFSDGAWANYTRHYPAGSYNVYARVASGAGTTTYAALDQVTGGWGTQAQTTNLLGTFTIPTTGWESYNYIPLRDGSGNLVTLTFNGSTNTLRLRRPVAIPPSADVNANFMMLSPLFIINASHSGTNVVISFLSQSGFNYQVQYKNHLTDASWTSLGSPMAGNNAVESVDDPADGSTRFYRVQIQ